MNSLQTLLSKFDKRWLGAGAAAAGAMAASQASEAAIVWSGVVNINVPSTTAGVYLNVVTGATGATSALAGWDINPWSSTSLNFFSSTTSGQTVATNMRTLAGSTTTYARLAPGASIGPADPFSTNVGTQTVNAGAPMLLNSSDNCVGFRFQNEATGQIHYGTARIQMGGTTGGQPRNIVDYAYESTPGVGIVACAPEPSSLALLALGAVGLIRRRK
ncbi:hypothetical protein RAS2_31230 [Phycisphaerae bacterium RAS2]|nr:hypothetical protein RAS2_31230 [Phycisphaerae bacterium RAS2]